MSTVWKKRNLGYLYHFSVIVLCLSNSAFLIYHICDFSIDFDNTTNILLTIIGFLFAFAGINIYSIFNTNIVTEKETLTELSTRHKKQLEQSRFDMDASLLLMNIVSNGIMVSTAKRFNSQYVEQLRSIKIMLYQLKAMLNQLEKTGGSQSEQFKDLMGKLLEVIWNLRNQLDYHKKMIAAQTESTFFRKVSAANRREAFAHIDSLLEEIKGMESYFTKKEVCRITIAESVPRQYSVWTNLKHLLSDIRIKLFHWVK